MTRTIHGVIRDEQGRPVARAWVGDYVTRGRDLWEPVDPLDRLRESKEPYRDDQGRDVPPGKLGKYCKPTATTRGNGTRFILTTSGTATTRALSVYWSRWQCRWSRVPDLEISGLPEDGAPQGGRERGDTDRRPGAILGPGGILTAISERCDSICLIGFLAAADPFSSME